MVVSSNYVADGQTTRIAENGARPRRCRSASAVADLVRVYQFRDRDRICCHDVSVTQCYALETMVEHGPLRLSALADRLFLDKSTTSRVVSTLVRRRDTLSSAPTRKMVALSR